MIRVTRLADYGIMLLTLFAREGGGQKHSARDMARRARLPQPTVSKILKKLAHHGVLEGHRGPRGGFRLARRPEEVTVADIIAAMEGPLGLTECSAHPGECTLEGLCPARSNWLRINQAFRDALKSVSLADMARPPGFSIAGRRGAGPGKVARSV